MRKYIKFWTILLIAAMIVLNCPNVMASEIFGSEETSETFGPEGISESETFGSDETSETLGSEETSEAFSPGETSESETFGSDETSDAFSPKETSESEMPGSDGTSEIPGSEESEENTVVSFADGEDQTDNDLFTDNTGEMIILEGTDTNPEDCSKDGKGTNPEDDQETGFFVVQADISRFPVSLSKTQCTYNGEIRKPTVTISDGSLTLKKGRDYTVTYQNNRKVGLGTVVITGIGAYKGKITKHFRINPKGTYLRSVTAGHQCITLTWKEQDVQITGYQIRYSTDSGFKNQKKVSIPSGTTKKILKDLRPGKKYFLQIRTYKKIDGKNFYSGWSNVKTVSLKLNTIIVEKKQRQMTIRMINPASGLKNVKAAVFSKQNGTDDVKRITLSRQSDGSYRGDCSYGFLKHSGICSVRCYDGDEYLNRKTVEITDGDIFVAKWLFGGDSRIDYAQCAVNIARNDYFGYGHTWPRTISCAGLVGLTLTYCGYGDFVKDDPLGWGYIDLGTYSGYNWRKVMEKEVGAIWHPGLNGLQEGDILYYDYGYYNNHTGIYLGNGLTVEARGPGVGTANDDSGTEVAIYSNFRILPWQGYYRIPNSMIHYR